MVLTNFNTFLEQAISGNFTSFNTRRASRYLDKLSLQPTYQTEIAILREMALDPDPAGNVISTIPKADGRCVEARADSEVVENATIVALQYYGQIIIQAINTYGLETEDHIQGLYDDLNAVNTTQTSNQTYMDGQVTLAAHLTADIVNESFDEFLSGVQWLMPMAVRSEIRKYDSRRSMGPTTRDGC